MLFSVLFLWKDVSTYQGMTSRSAGQEREKEKKSE